MTMAVVLFIFIPKILSHREELASRHRRSQKFKNSYGAGIAPRKYETFTIQRDLNENNNQANESKSRIAANDKVEEEQKCEIEPPSNLFPSLTPKQEGLTTKLPSLYL